MWILGATQNWNTIMEVYRIVLRIQQQNFKFGIFWWLFAGLVGALVSLAEIVLV
jgi:hypothetical protein